MNCPNCGNEMTPINSFVMCQTDPDESCYIEVGEECKKCKTFNILVDLPFESKNLDIFLKNYCNSNLTGKTLKLLSNLEDKNKLKKKLNSEILGSSLSQYYLHPISEIPILREFIKKCDFNFSYKEIYFYSWKISNISDKFISLFIFIIIFIK